MDQNFRDKIIAARGDQGKKVLSNIPQLINKYENEWSIRVLDPFTPSYNYVAPAVSSNGTHLVFKIGLYGHDQFRPEHDALKILNIILLIDSL